MQYKFYDGPSGKIRGFHEKFRQLPAPWARCTPGLQFPGAAGRMVAMPRPLPASSSFSQWSISLPRLFRAPARGRTAFFPRWMRPSVLIFLLAVLIAPLARAEKLEDLKPQGYVNDFAGVLNDDSREQIKALCLEVQQKTGAQIAVVTIKTLDGQPIEDFANRLYARWGIGPKSDNRGVLILVVTDDHKYRIEVGYGLEPILPDGKVGGFGREAVPLFRQGDYSAGVFLMTRRVADVIAQDKGVTLEGAPPPSDSDDDASGHPTPNIRTIIWIIIIIAWVLFGIIRSIFRAIVGRRPGTRSSFPWWWLLFMGGGGGRGGGGGGFGGFGGGGGGFGGFGGGMSGGGGASGGW